MNDKPKSSKIISVLMSIVFWILTVFFLIMAVGFITSPVMLLCFLGCAIFSCPLINRLPIKVSFRIRIPVILVLFIIAGFSTPPYIENEQDNSNAIAEINPPDSTKNTDKEDKSIKETDSENETNNETDMVNSEDLTSDISNNPEEPITEDAASHSIKNSSVEEILSEEEFKAQCTELWHDDVFFSDSLSVGDYVKLDLFLEEERYFNADSIYNNIASDFINEHNLQRSFYYCGVRREDEMSYMGGQLSLYFPEDCGYSASDMTVGDHLIFYGEVIEFSTNTVDGYNYCGIIPRYIENNGQ